MPDPTVTFIVPCYRLAHYLRECVSSILRQSFADLEIIVLDDRSPDDTAEVARALVEANPDGRVRYVLNERNLGNIGNYNKGIGMARGRYVWILSPDDRLRHPDIVARYVRLLESNAAVGYAFCPAHTIAGEEDVGVNARSVYGSEDRIVDRAELVRDIVDNSFELVAASVMIRKECYERVTLFPADMPHRGDSYLWALIALEYDVAYFAEPMVDYRVHAGSMMSTLAREKIATIVQDDIAVPWRVRQAALLRGATAAAEYCTRSIVLTYRNAAMGVECRGHRYDLSLEEIQASLARWEPGDEARAAIRRMLAARLYWSGLAELCRRRFTSGRRALGHAFSLDPRLLFAPPLREVGHTELGGRVVDRVRRGARTLFRRTP